MEFVDSQQQASPTNTETVSSRFGCGDSFVIDSIIEHGDLGEASQLTEENVFEQVRSEVHFQEMFHKGGPVPRLIAIQGELEGQNGWYPLYRHPADEQPTITHWTPCVLAIKHALEKKLNGEQIFNHVLIQWYRSGLDYISPHADKTLDIARGSAIVNVSLGATRYMQLKPKKNNFQLNNTGLPLNEISATCDDEALSTAGTVSGAEVAKAERIKLSHNSAFVLGWDSNRIYTHGIKVRL
jgi:alkylated DNA repair dioxygenase AlkB